MAVNLSVNVNKIALLRNSRGRDYPSVVGYSQRCLELGANGITVHPRPDCRHIKPSDVIAIASLIKQWKHQDSQVEFNIEGNPFAQSNVNYPGLDELVARCQPDQVTLVPDNDSQLTSDSGFDLNQQLGSLSPIIKRYQQQGSRVCLFMDADPNQLELVKLSGADRIELYTGPYAEDPNNQAIFDSYVTTATKAEELGIGINAGHDLNLDNIAKFRTIEGLQEVSIGHALTVESLEFGLETVIKNYLTLLS